MAQTATVYNLTIDLADMDRNTYESISLRIARQPSETAEYMLVRVLAYCLEYRDGIVLTEGVAAGNDPAIVVRDLTGQITAWIEVGLPDAARLHRGMKLAGQAAVYTHRDVRKLISQLSSGKIYKSEEIPIYAFDPAFVDGIAPLIERRTGFSLSVTDRELYMNIAESEFTTTLGKHSIG